MFFWFWFILAGQTITPTAKASWQPLKSGHQAGMRGLAVLNEQVAWTGGADGVWGRTLDGGQTWENGKVPGSELDFRDVVVFDEKQAILMSVGAGPASRIFATKDGGKNWELIYTNPWEKGFFDSISFWDHKNGILLSDPIDDRPFLLITADGGYTWERLPADTFPPLAPEEYAFAASGSCIALAGQNHIWLATGGASARVFHSSDRGRTWVVQPTPIRSGNNSSGIFSIAFRNEQQGIIVGGDYQSEKLSGATAAWTDDGGKSWHLARNQSEISFRSCVSPVPEKPGFWVAVGPAASSLTMDDGRSWFTIPGGYHVVAFGKAANSGFAAGRDGLLGKLNWPEAEKISREK